MKNAVAPGNVKRFAEAKLLFHESQHWTRGAESRARREAKKQLHRAVRRSERACIEEPNATREDLLDEVIEAMIEELEYST